MCRYAGNDYTREDTGLIKLYRQMNIIAGDNVSLELSPYDLTKGRITYRFK